MRVHLKEFEVEKYLTIITSSFANHLTTELAKINLPLGQNQVFTFIAIIQNEGVSQDSIGKLIKLDKISVSRAVKRLMNEGLVYKVKDEKDKRVNRVYVTDEGSKSALKVKQIVRKFVSTMFGKLNPVEIIDLNEQIETLAANIVGVKYI